MKRQRGCGYSVVGRWIRFGEDFLWYFEIVFFKGILVIGSYSDKVTDMSANELYAFLKHLPEKVNIDQLANSVGFLSFH